jgi:hypothetical protein
MKERKGQEAALIPAAGAPAVGGQPFDAKTEAATQFIKVERDLAALGFFSPTHKDLRGRRVKIVRLSGGEVERKIRIVTGGNYGLPGTGDLDKWLALQSLLNAIQRAEGVVANPVTFTTADLLNLLGVRKDSGKNYKDVEDWLDRMCATSIESEGSGILSGKRKFAKLRGLRVFDKAVSVGRELDGGAIATKNFIWLSAWQLESINSNNLIPIDLTTYLALKNAIAKTLLPLLQVWFYATHEAGTFEKRYDDLCELLGIRRYDARSDIERKLKPSLDELMRHGYIATWSVERSKVGGGFKLALRHGPRFTERAQKQLPPAGDEQRATWLAELVKRGVDEPVALELLRGIPPDRQLLDQLDYIDYKLANWGGGAPRNAPGYIVSQLRKNVQVPPEFETRSKREARERTEGEGRDAERRSREAEERATKLKEEYDEYCAGEVEDFIERLPGDELKRLNEEAREAVLSDQPALKNLKEKILKIFILDKLKVMVAPRVEVLSFDEYCRARAAEGN